MEDVKLFFDTYALIEIYNGGENYKKFQKTRVITSYFHLFELYYILSKEKNEEEFIEFFKYLQNFCIDLKFNWIIEASKFRQKYNKRNLSYADYIGYIIAKDLEVKFLTGDKEFEYLPNLEFVKK